MPFGTYSPTPYAGPSLANPEKRYDPWDNLIETGKGELRRRSSDIEGQEYGRYQQGLGTLTGAYNESRSALAKLIDPSLLFSKASDAIGARGVSNMNALRSSLGARGLNPNSGAASGLLSRLAFQTNNDITGATRDVAIENQRQRQVNAAQNFANAMGLANYTNSPVSAVGLDTESNIFEGDLARLGLENANKSSKRAAKTAREGALLGGGLGILGNLVGGL